MNDHQGEREGAAGRAFVVQFLPPDDEAGTAFRGRVERIASGESRRFHSAQELVAFMTQSLGGKSKSEREEES